MLACVGLFVGYLIELGGYLGYDILGCSSCSYCGSRILSVYWTQINKNTLVTGSGGLAHQIGRWIWETLVELRLMSDTQHYNSDL